MAFQFCERFCRSIRLIFYKKMLNKVFLIKSDFQKSEYRRLHSMLVLTRRTGETIVIADEITVSVLGVKGNQIRLGIIAPEYISVHREEIHEKIKVLENGKNR